MTPLSTLLLWAACADPSSRPGGAGNPGGAPGGGPTGRPEVSGWSVAAGQGAALSGTVSYGGSVTGALRIDFLVPGAEAGGLPKLVHSMTLAAVGPWSVEAPKATGTLAVVAYLDPAMDGPSPGDPAGRIAGTLSVGDAALTGLDIALSDSPDLGDLAPSSTKPSGGGAPPAGAVPGAGAPPAH